MDRMIRRTYAFSRPEVRECILAWLKSKDIQRPDYVGNTPECTWTDREDGTVIVEWTATDEVDR